MINGMTFYPQAVVLNGKVYLGGGRADDMDLSTVVTCYDIERNQWSALPRYVYEFFAMATINSELMLIGGRSLFTTNTSRGIGVWNESLHKWTPEISVLLTARDAATAIAYDDRWLIVVGGRDDAYQSLSKVDIVDVMDNYRLYPGAPLPQHAHKMTAAVVGSTLVLLGGFDDVNSLNNRVFSVKLDDLISQAVLSESESASLWQSLPNTPVVSCAALAFNGTLLAIGGSQPGDPGWNSEYTDLHVFNFGTRAWAEAGKLLTSRLKCACTVLPSGEMFITGGSSFVSGRFKKEVHIAALAPQ